MMHVQKKAFRSGKAHFVVIVTLTNSIPGSVYVTNNVNNDHRNDRVLHE